MRKNNYVRVVSGMTLCMLAVLAFVYWFAVPTNSMEPLRIVAESKEPEMRETGAKKTETKNRGSQIKDTIKSEVNTVAETIQWTPISNIADTEALLLVNEAYPLEQTLTESAVISAYRVVPLAVADISLHPLALDAVTQWFAAAADMGFDLYVSSGYRTADEQSLVYEAAADKSYAQPSGASEHQTGLAADIAVMGLSGAQMIDSAEAAWLAETAWQYGMILRYPADKEAKTGISYEPWHFRYVGLPHAYYCYVNNLCWEEYLDKLDAYELTLDGVTYQVYYAEAEDGRLPLPANTPYTVSGDNKGRYVITQFGTQ